MKKKPGPKPQFGVAMKRQIVMLDEMTLRKARALAQAEQDGNLSKIVREAIFEKYERYQRLA